MIYNLCQDIYDANDNKGYLITTFSGLSKVFDAVPHTIQLDKRRVYGT